MSDCRRRQNRDVHVDADNVFIDANRVVIRTDDIVVRENRRRQGDRRDCYDHRDRCDYRGDRYDNYNRGCGCNRRRRNCFWW